jgi:Fe-S-cluster containining protein
MGDRCTGHCCERFYLPNTPGELENIAKCAEKGDATVAKEFRKVADMVIFLRRDDHKGVYHYTCKHFDVATRNCTDYEDRPRMCRSFPNDRPCPYEGCTNHPELRPDVRLSVLRVGRDGESLEWRRKFRLSPDDEKLTRLVVSLMEEK